jgi:hypothetical protein
MKALDAFLPARVANADGFVEAAMPSLRTQ